MALARTLLLLIALSMIATAAIGGVAATNVAVGQYGYHPSQHKQVVVYTTAETGTFDIYAGTTKAFSGTLTKPKDDNGDPIACQGNQTCLVGEFTGLAKEGTYHVRVGADRSPDFRISANVFKERTPLFMEVFEAFRQQGSAYHKDLHSQETPPFLMMTDGSFVMPTDHLAVAGVRLASAYNKNPSLLSFDNYQVTNPDAPDVAEQIKRHAQVMASYQDAAGGTQVPLGYKYNFDCPMEYRPDEERYTTGKNACLLWVSSTSVSNAAQALHLYAAAIPAVHQLDGTAGAAALLERAKRTHAYMKGQTLSDDTAASFGAASFMLYDYTGDAAYLRDGHNQRAKVSTSMDAINSRAREHYWEEYIRHKAAIQAAGLQYDINGRQPESFFGKKIDDDWTSSKHPINAVGERIYVLDINSGFQHSRYMLSEALFAAKAQQYASSMRTKVVADNHLQWLTGMNSVQEGHQAGPVSSRSFIFGIGNHGKNQHIRIVQPNFYDDGMSYNNGRAYIPGWVSGALDPQSSEDPDGILNYHDTFWSWEYTETTDEIVAMAVELNAYLDAQYNNRVELTRPRLSSAPLPVCVPSNGGIEACDQKDNDCDAQIDEGGVCVPPATPNSSNSTTPPSAPTGTTCYSTLKDIPSTCTGGSIITDVHNGCRTIVCASDNASLQVTACDKPSGTPTHFEMYAQERTGIGIGICIGATCISDGGYAQSSNYPLCAATAAPTTPPIPSIPAVPTTPTAPSADDDAPRSRGGGGGGGGSPRSAEIGETPVKVTLSSYSAYSFDIGGSSYTMRAQDIGEDEAIVSLRATETILRGGEDVDLDIDGDGSVDVNIELLDAGNGRVVLYLRASRVEVADAPAGTTDVSPIAYRIEYVETAEDVLAEESLAADPLPADLPDESSAGIASGRTLAGGVIPGSPVLWVIGAAALVTIAGAMMYSRRTVPEVGVYDDTLPRDAAPDPIAEPAALDDAAIRGLDETPAVAPAPAPAPAEAPEPIEVEQPLIVERQEPDEFIMDFQDGEETAPEEDRTPHA